MEQFRFPSKLIDGVMKKRELNRDLVLEGLLFILLIALVAYSIAYKTPILYNQAGYAHHPIQLPANLTSNGGLNQSISDLNSLPGR